LKDDGDFGPITEKAVKAFQKKFGLKNDGKVGDYTLATITFGKKLPEMKVGDYTAKGKIWSNHSEITGKIALNFKALAMEIDNLAKDIRSSSEGAHDATVLNADNYQYIAGFAKSITSLQKDFISELIKNPKKAEQLAKRCEEIERELKSVGNARIVPASRYHSSVITSLQRSIDYTFGRAKNVLKGLEKFSNSSYSD